MELPTFLVAVKDSQLVTNFIEVSRDKQVGFIAEKATELFHLQVGDLDEVVLQFAGDELKQYVLVALAPSLIATSAVL